MKCGKAQELFSSYLEKTIQPPMGVAFEQHLADCARCEAAYDRFHATTIVLDELPMVEPPPDLHSIIMARVDKARREAPGGVRWLHLDWQSVFTVRVSAKALTAAAAVLLVFVMLMQITPIHSYVSAIFGLQRASNHMPADQDYVTQPQPAGVGGVRYADVGAGLSVGVKVDTNRQTGTLYDIGLAAQGDAPISVQVYELPEGSVGSGVHSSDLTSVRFVGAVSSNKVATARIIQPSSGGRARVAMIVWKNGSQWASELVFLPPKFASVAAGPGVSLADAGLGEVLSALSADYGAVILASGECRVKTGSVSVSASSADAAMAEAARQAGFELRPLAPSIFVVR